MAAVVDEKPVKPAKGEIVVKYRDHRGEPNERTFSRDVHGEDFAELAAKFKKINASRISMSATRTSRPHRH